MNLLLKLVDPCSLEYFLDTHANDQHVDEYRVWNMIADLALGLKHLHDLNIVHLDMKPSNVFITEEGSLKIGDFGMAMCLLPVCRLLLNPNSYHSIIC
jgi:serine/threonine protein kinase